MITVAVAYAVFCTKGPALFFDETKALEYAAKYHGRVVALQPTVPVRPEDWIQPESKTLDLFPELK